MAKYMKGNFSFLGIPSPQRRAIQREVLGGRWKPTEPELVAFADTAWARPEREFQYVACDLVDRGATRMSAAFIDDLERWITRRSWWDTVDALAASVGAVVRSHPEVADRMELWIDSDDVWLTRAAIIHQLRFKGATDEARLFRFCLRRGQDSEFFIRKAIGWALREYSKTDPAAVTTFVAAHDAELSPLSRREALRRVSPM
ncbi:MAG: DNA alkylation repair protein [Acidimicrobiia bacterium]|nr:DNA alkylation repair protein [Acidimicrobiia bacterium]